MYVSSYDEAFNEGFRRAIENLGDPQTADIKKFVDALHERIVQTVHNDIVDYLVQNINDDIAQRAARVAERMIASAVAGDSETIKNLFGFQFDYNAQSWMFGEPKQWELIDVIVRRNPQLFVDERFLQLEAEVKSLKADLSRTKHYCDEHHSSRSTDF